MSEREDAVGQGDFRGIDSHTPSSARIYDALLGGKDNFAVDREAADKLAEIYPEARTAVLANRQFLVTAVELCAKAGVRQFIDLGTGIPTSPNVHEVAREIHADANVVYVDNDPVVTVHNRALRATDTGITAIEADMRDPEAVLSHPETNRLIDFTEPVAVLAVAVMHFVPDSANPAGILSAYAQRMAPGSHLVMTVATTDGATEEEIAQGQMLYQNSSSPLILRDRAEIMPWLAGFELVGPGLAPVVHWLDDPGLETRIPGLAAIARR